jgi:hypothetical protein
VNAPDQIGKKSDPIASYPIAKAAFENFRKALERWGPPWSVSECCRNSAGLGGLIDTILSIEEAHVKPHPKSLSARLRPALGTGA